MLRVVLLLNGLLLSGAVALTHAGEPAAQVPETMAGNVQVLDEAATFPACQIVWLEGQTLPAAYDGCLVETTTESVIAAPDFWRCDDGSFVVLYAEGSSVMLSARAGGTIARNPADPCR